MKILILIIPWCVVSYFLGIISNKLWNNLLKNKENNIRIRIKKEEISKQLEEYSSEQIADELFERQEVWDIIQNKAKRE